MKMRLQPDPVWGGGGCLLQGYETRTGASNHRKRKLSAAQRSPVGGGLASVPSLCQRLDGASNAPSSVWKIQESN